MHSDLRRCVNLCQSFLKSGITIIIAFTLVHNMSESGWNHRINMRQKDSENQFNFSLIDSEFKEKKFFLLQTLCRRKQPNWINRQPSNGQGIDCQLKKRGKILTVNELANFSCYFFQIFISKNENEGRRSVLYMNHRLQCAQNTFIFRSIQ